MEKRLESRRSMFLIVEEFIQNSDPAIINLMPNFNVIFNDFEEIVKQVRDANEQRMYDRKENRIQKLIHLRKMSELAVTVARNLRNYAWNTQKWTLYGKLNKTVNMLMRMQDTSSQDYCQLVHDEANLYLADLAPYGITAPTLAELQDAILEYQFWLYQPRKAIVDRKQYTALVRVLILKGMKMLRLMDMYISALQYSHPDFYKKYFDSRIIVDVGSRKLSLRGVVYNQFGTLQSGVTVRIASLGVQTLSTSLGNFEFKSLPPGIHMAEFSKPGYEMTSEQFAIVANQRTDIKVEIREVVSGAIAS